MIATVDAEGIGTLELTYTERGAGVPVLLLHGGAGPISVAPWGELLARTYPVRVITPTHPGFAGTARPAALASIGAVARVYAAFLDGLGLEGVRVVGNSVGGWIAAELALAAPHRVARLVIIDAAGLDVPGHAVADVFSMPIDEISRRSYHDPARFRIDPSKLTPELKAGLAANMATLKVLSGNMTDPTLGPRLSRLRLPTMVLWGESDGIMDPEFGHAYARAIPGATFHLVRGAGHLPQVETPEALAELAGPFLAERGSA